MIHTLVTLEWPTKQGGSCLLNDTVLFLFMLFRSNNSEILLRMFQISFNFVTYRESLG